MTAGPGLLADAGTWGRANSKKKKVSKGLRQTSLRFVGGKKDGIRSNRAMEYGLRRVVGRCPEKDRSATDRKKRVKPVLLEANEGKKRSGDWVRSRNL